MNRDNIMATINDLKSELRRIDITRQQLESSINTLLQLLESPFIAAQVSRPVLKRRPKLILTPPDAPKAEVPIASDRVHAVLKDMQGRFSRSELYKKASEDGYGFIAPGTFANIFIKLINRKQIICVEGAVGQRDAVFMKADDEQNGNQNVISLAAKIFGGTPVEREGGGG